MGLPKEEGKEREGSREMSGCVMIFPQLQVIGLPPQVQNLPNLEVQIKGKLGMPGRALAMS